MKPTVSVIVPAYNYGKFLKQCIESVLAQTFQDFEVLVIDDMSTDDTPRIIQQFKDPRVFYYRNEKHLGHVRTFNVGVQISRGRYLNLLSADDYMLSQQNLELKVRVLEENPQVGIVFSSGIMVNEEGEVVARRCLHHLPLIKNRNVLNLMLKYNVVYLQPLFFPCSELIRRECFEEVGGFDENLQAYEDWELWLRMAARYNVTFLPQDLVAKRSHIQGQSKRNITSGIAYRDLKIFMERVFKNYPTETRYYSFQKLYSQHCLKIFLARLKLCNSRHSLREHLEEYVNLLRIYWPNMVHPVNLRVVLRLIYIQIQSLLTRNH